MELGIMTLLEKLKSYKIILASASLRRQELLKELGAEFEVIVKPVDESFPDNLKGKEIAEYVAISKAKMFEGAMKANELVIAADTIVALDDKILGKPSDEEDAIRMLKDISGKTHEVVTGVAILFNGKLITFTDTTQVTFREMTEEELIYYVEQYSPYDKAGAYGIQEWIGLAACTRIEGSFYNVMGLPVEKLYSVLNNIFVCNSNNVMFCSAAT